MRRGERMAEPSRSGSATDSRPAEPGRRPADAPPLRAAVTVHGFTHSVSVRAEFFSVFGAFKEILSQQRSLRSYIALS